MKSQSVFEQKLKQGFKDKYLESLSEDAKQEYRLKKLDEFFELLGNKKNRYLLYCPDIALVNHLVKLIYDFANTAKKLGYNVIVLHEIDGFKCKWLHEIDESYKDINIQYIIKKKAHKSNKKQQTYQFEPTDTIIVPDAFQEIFDNIYEVKFIQKVLLVTGYNGIGSLAPGVNYKQLGVTKFIFENNNLKENYARIFGITDSLVLNSKIESKFYNENIVVPKDIYPVICISGVGNVKLTQQVINTFYNLYPNLNVFSFKTISRNTYKEYNESLKHSCLYLVLDEDIISKNQFIESIIIGTPVATYHRIELENDDELKDVQLFERNIFSIVEFLSKFCVYWLETKSEDFKNSTLEVAKNITYQDLINEEKYLEKVKFVLDDLQESRIKYFLSYRTASEQIK